MSARDLLTKAADALASDADGAVDSPSRRATSARASNRTIAAMEAALVARAKSRRRRLWAGRCAVAASSILFLLGGVRLAKTLHSSAAPTAKPELVATGRSLSGVASAWHNGQSVRFEGAHLVSGDRVTTAGDAHAEIALSTGTSVVLAPAADVTFTHVGAVQAFDLGTGSVNARVAKLHEGERFLVRTHDVEVEVRGTMFEVALVAPDATCGDGTPTRVRVTEGVVVVRKEGIESRVAAGEVWPKGCVTAPTHSPTSAASAAVPPLVQEPASVPAPSVASTRTTMVASAGVAPSVVDTLAIQNDLFASALSARRRGDLRTSLAGFDAYLARYPSGEHAEGATAQRMTLLGKLEPSQAPGAARAYLAQWPSGFARADAESLIAGAGTATTTAPVGSASAAP